MRTKHRLLALAVAAALTVAASAPAAAFLDKTRFVAHLGVAYFAFHHWVMKPYQEQKFADGAPHRTASVVKAGAALLFAVHEVRVSDKIARESKDPLLQKLDAGVVELESTFSSVGQRFKSGQFNPGDVSVLKTVTGELSSRAAASGAPIKDVPTAIPGV